MTTMSVMTMGGLGILAVAWIATALLRTASASLRHLIWLAGLAAVLALPLLNASGLRVAVPVPATVVRSVVQSTVATARTPPRPAVATRVLSGGADRAAVGNVSPGPAATRIEAGVAPVPARREMSVTGPEADGDAAPGSSASTVAEPRSPASRAILAAVWMTGALALLGATFLGHLRAWAITARDVSPATIAVRARSSRAARALGIRRPVRVVVSERVRVPATWGILRPTIVLPPDHGRWSEETLDRVLAHELAHVRRADCASYMLGEMSRALHWPNPLAWLAVHRLRTESERACDDRVLGLVDTPSAYAEDLIAMVRTLRAGQLPRAALAVARPSGLATRVRAILDPSQRRERVGTAGTLAVGAAAAFLALSATAFRPMSESEAPVAEASAAARELTALAPVPGRAGEEPGQAPQRGGADAVGASVGADLRDTRRRVPTPNTPVAIAVAQERLCVFRESGRRSTSMSVDDEEVRIRWETDDCRVEIEMEGDVEFSSDDRRIVSMGPEAIFEVEERIGDDRRRVRLEGVGGGDMDRRYWEDGDAVAWGPVADQWLAQVLPELFRHTTINAEARVRRMVEEGGAGRVFAEVEQMVSDHVSGRYLELLMDATDLTEAEYRRVIELAGAIDSDHGSASLLLAVVDRAGLRASFQDPLLAASEGLESDHQRTRVLEALLRSPLSPEQLDAVLRSASSIESDHNLSELLSTIARDGRLDDAGRASFLDALRSVESDHSTATVIFAFLDSGPLGDDELSQVLDMTADIESDHQLGEILQRVAEDYPLTGGQVTAYLRSAARIESDHQTAETATAIIERAAFDREQLELVLRMAERVESDHQRGTILQVLIERRDLAPDEVSRLLGVAGGIESDHQLASTLATLLEEQDLGADGLEGLLSTVRGVESSHQRTELLLRIAGRYELEGRARTLYLDLTGDLSRRDRERAVEAVGQD